MNLKLLQLHYIGPHAGCNRKPQCIQLHCTQNTHNQPSAGEGDIKIRQLGCTSSRCVAIWQWVLICCVVCGALGQMCPLCAQLKAYSTWAEGGPHHFSPSIFLTWNSIWMKKKPCHWLQLDSSEFPYRPLGFVVSLTINKALLLL